MGATVMIEVEVQTMPGDDRTAADGPGGGAGEGRRPETYMAPAGRGLVGDVLKADRIRLGLDQSEVAADLGFSQSKISAYEVGRVKHPPPDRLVALARRYGRPDHYYLGIAGWRNGAKLVQAIEAHKAALTAMEERPALQDLLSLAAGLPDDALSELLAYARDELQWTDERQDHAATATPAAKRRDSA